MFGWTGALTTDQTAKIAAMKRVIYDGFRQAVADGVPHAKAGILVDEQYGAQILGAAAEHGYITACPAEKSGQDEFDFEYGEDFPRHIEAFRPTFCKVRQWLKTAAAVPGFIGFAVGRTSFWEPLSEWKDGRIAREAAVKEIARRYREWVDIFEAACATSGPAAP